eukprot:scaffold12184_cov114-Isochrysis_galbana.AAC.17
MCTAGAGRGTLHASPAAGSLPPYLPGRPGYAVELRLERGRASSRAMRTARASTSAARASMFVSKIQVGALLAQHILDHHISLLSSSSPRCRRRRHTAPREPESREAEKTGV